MVLFFCPFRTPFDELVVDRSFHESPTSGATTLTLIEEETEVGGFDGVVQVGILEDDERTFASEFERDPFEVRHGGVGGHHFPDLRTAGESHFVHQGVLGDGGSGRGSVSRNDIDDSRGKSGFGDQLRHVETGERSLLGQFHHHRAAARQRRAQLPRLHKKREVPGNDLAGDADGFVAREADVISGDRNRLAVNLVRPSGVISIALDGKRQVCHVGDHVGFPVVQRLQRG